MPERDAGEIIFGVWSIYRNDEKVFKFKGYYPPFGIRVAIFVVEDVLFNNSLGEVYGDGERFVLSENGGAAVSLAFCRVPIFFIERQINFAFSLHRFRFLQAQNVGLKFFYKRHEKAFLVHCPEPIYIPRNYAHVILFRMKFFMNFS
jgi:hypothetical protein